MKTAVVIPVGPGREENLVACLNSLMDQVIQPEGIVLVHDGPEAMYGQVEGSTIPIAQVVLPEKHRPGLEQPRNIGVRHAVDTFGVDHCWFVDSDIIYQPHAMQRFIEAHGAVPEDRILVGPYDWLPQGIREIVPDLHNDPRWVTFSKTNPGEVFHEDIGAGLGCFSGNLVWPVKEFTEVGGFWSEIHHGRCEDGELGLRATALGVPISFVPEARGWHLWHPVDHQAAVAKNTRDVPMLNARHPWVEGEGLAVVPKDGRRFDVRCETCSKFVNTIEWWSHVETCGRQPDPGVVIPEAMP